MVSDQSVVSSSTSRSDSRSDRYGSSDDNSRNYRRRRAYSSPSSDDSDFSSRSSRHRYRSPRRWRRRTSASSYGSSSYSSSYRRHRNRSRSFSSRDSRENTARVCQKLQRAMASQDVGAALEEAVQAIRDSQGRMPNNVLMKDVISLCLKEGLITALTALLRAQRDELCKSRPGTGGAARLQSRRDRPIKVSHLVRRITRAADGRPVLGGRSLPFASVWADHAVPSSRLYRRRVRARASGSCGYCPSSVYWRHRRR